MNNQTAAMRRPLYLTEEEALALLDMCLMTEAQDDSLKLQAVDRVTRLCREFLRAELEAVDRVETHSPPFRRGAFSRLIQRYEALSG